MSIQILILTLLVPIVTGITFIAYKHPVRFKKAAIPLVIVISFNSMIKLASTLGSSVSCIQILNETLVRSPNEKISTVGNPITSLSANLDTFKWTILTAVASLSYLLFLYWLPRILNLKSATKIDEAI